MPQNERDRQDGEDVEHAEAENRDEVVEDGDRRSDDGDRERAGRDAGQRALQRLTIRPHAGSYQADQPPSTTRFAPVTYDEASDARKTTAPSASPASAIRPSGTRAP